MDENSQSLKTYTKLIRAAETALSCTQKHLSPQDLTLSQFGVLEALHHLGPLCQKELGQKILKSSGNITTVIDNLERRGLVRRERSSVDRRYVTVKLSSTGASLIQEVFPGVENLITEGLSCLSELEQDILAASCKKLGRAMEESPFSPK